MTKKNDTSDVGDFFYNAEPKRDITNKSCDDPFVPGAGAGIPYLRSAIYGCGGMAHTSSWKCGLGMGRR